MLIATILLLSSFWVAYAQDLSPAPVTRVFGTFDGATILLTWELSADDTVGVDETVDPLSDSPSGVSGYNILMGVSAEDLELIATVPAATDTFRAESLPSGVPSIAFRIDAFDDENVSPGFIVDVNISSSPGTFAGRSARPNH